MFGLVIGFLFLEFCDKSQVVTKKKMKISSKGKEFGEVFHTDVLEIEKSLPSLSKLLPKKEH